MLVNRFSQIASTLNPLFKNADGWFGVAVLCALGALNVSTGFYGHDQIENVLGAQELLRGSALYSQYFTQHGPLLYYVTAALRSVTPLVLLPWVFNGLLVLWAVWARRTLAGVIGVRLSWFIGAGLLIALPYVGGQTILDETFVAVASCTALVLLLRYLVVRGKYSIVWTTVSVGLLAEAGVLSSYAYIPYAVFLVVFCVILICFHSRGAARWRTLGLFLAALSAPMLILGASLLATQALDDFIFATYTFNRDFYAPFVPFPNTITEWFTAGAGNVLRMLWEAAQKPSLAALKLVALLAPFGVALAYLGLKRAWLQLILITGTCVFLATRVMHMQDYTLTTYAAHHHSAPLVLASLVVLGYALLLGKQSIASVRAGKRLHHVITRWFLLGFAAITLSMYAWFSLQLSAIIAQYTPPRTMTVPACMVNALTSAQGTTWLGPYMMYDVLLLKPKRATRFSYFFPLHAACPQCKGEFLTDLARAYPDVLIANVHFTMFEKTVAEYLPELPAFLQDRYWQLNRVGAEKLYFSHALPPETVETAWQHCAR